MILEKTKTVSRDYATARGHIESLHSAGQLGESALEGFAAANHFEETTVALAVLCGLPIEEVDRAMVQDAPETVLVMIKAIGMSWPTAKAILRVRAGARGISPGELEQCQGTFNRLKRATAQQVIAFQGQRSRFTRSAQTAA
jgi:hypothetical protein